MVKVIVSRGGREVCDEGREGEREGGREGGREGSLDSRSSLPAYIHQLQEQVWAWDEALYLCTTCEPSGYRAAHAH